MLKETEGKGNKTPAKPKGHDASAKTKSNATAAPAKGTAVPAAPGKPPKGTPKAKAKSKAKAKGGAKGEGNGNDKGKGKGKGKGNNDPKGPPPKADSSAKAKATVPCVFFPKGTCNRGKDCPFSHEAGRNSKPKGASVSSAAVATLLPTTAAGRAVTRVGKAATRGSYNSLLRIGFNAVCKVLAAFATFVCPDFSVIAHETWASQSLAAPAILSVQRSSGCSIVAISLIG